MNDTALVHANIYDILTSIRNSNSNFTFAIRQRNSIQSKEDRLKLGYTFHGNEDYLFIGLSKRGDSSNKTKQIGFCIAPIDLEKGLCHLEIVWSGENESRFIDCYNEIVKEIGGFEEKNKTKFYKYYTPPFSNAFNDFYQNDYPRIIEIIEKHHLKNELIYTPKNLMRTHPK